MTKLTILIIKYPYLNLILCIISYIVIRVLFIESIAYCEGWTLNFNIPSEEELLQYKETLLREKADLLKSKQEKSLILQERERVQALEDKRLSVNALQSALSEIKIRIENIRQIGYELLREINTTTDPIKLAELEVQRLKNINDLDDAKSFQVKIQKRLYITRRNKHESNQ